MPPATFWFPVCLGACNNGRWFRVEGLEVGQIPETNLPSHDNYYLNNLILYEDNGRENERYLPAWCGDKQ